MERETLWWAMEPWREHNYDQHSPGSTERATGREEYPESLSRPIEKQLAQKPEGKGSWETSSPVIQRRAKEVQGWSCKQTSS